MFRWVVLFGVWAAYSAFGLVATSLAPLVPLVEQDLQLSHTAMGSIMGAWQLTYIAAAIPCGLFLDRYPARYTLTSRHLAHRALSAFARIRNRLREPTLCGHVVWSWRTDYFNRRTQNHHRMV